MPRQPRQKLSLPTSPTRQLEHFWQHPFCVYGEKGIGKTTVGSVAVDRLLPRGHKSLNFRFERGRTNLPILQVPELPEKGPPERLTWRRFHDYLELFCDDDSFSVAVIDSLDKCYDECFEHVCSDAGVDHPSEAGDDAPSVWDRIKVEFEATLRAVQDAGKSFIFLSHQKEKRLRDVEGEEAYRMDLSCKPAAAKIVKDICEFVFYYCRVDASDDGKKKSDRVIYLRNRDNACECACGRGDVFLQPDGQPLFRIKIPNNPDAVGPTLQDAYDNKLWDYDHDPGKEERAARAARRRSARKKEKASPGDKPERKRTRRSKARRG